MIPAVCHAHHRWLASCAACTAYHLARIKGGRP